MVRHPEEGSDPNASTTRGMEEQRLPGVGSVSHKEIIDA